MLNLTQKCDEYFKPGNPDEDITPSRPIKTLSTKSTDKIASANKNKGNHSQRTGAVKKND